MTEQRPLAAVLGGELELRLFNYRDTTPLRAGQVDDEPYGGGAGMVLRVDVVAAALDAVYGGDPSHRVIALTPQGRQLTQAVVEELAAEPQLTLLSSRFEGFDERIVAHLCSDAISIGPYVLSGGELPAMVLVDAVARRLPGALAEGSGERESFSGALDGGLEYPHYTRPAEFRGWRVPDVLLSGDHGRSTSGGASRAASGASRHDGGRHARSLRAPRAAADATPDDIDDAYRREAAAAPDFERLREIESAYRVLADPVRRASYDRSLDDGREAEPEPAPAPAALAGPPPAPVAASEGGSGLATFLVALLVALAGAAVWALVVKATDYEVGALAWGIGLATGAAAGLVARRKTAEVQLAAVVAAADRRPRRQVPDLRARGPGGERAARSVSSQRRCGACSATTSAPSSASTTCSGSPLPSAAAWYLVRPEEPQPEPAAAARRTTGGRSTRTCRATRSTG